MKWKLVKNTKKLIVYKREGFNKYWRFEDNTDIKKYISDKKYYSVTSPTLIKKRFKTKKEALNYLTKKIK